MPGGDGAQQYILISDFSPGIQNSYSSKATPVRLDEENESMFAQEDGTWGCYGHPAGGLYPLPGVKQVLCQQFAGYGIHNDWNRGNYIPSGENSATPDPDYPNAYKHQPYPCRETPDTNYTHWVYDDDEFITATLVVSPLDPAQPSTDYTETESFAPGFGDGASASTLPPPDPTPDIIMWGTQRMAVDNLTPQVTKSTYHMFRWRSYRNHRHSGTYTETNANQNTVNIFGRRNRPFVRNMVLAQWVGDLTVAGGLAQFYNNFGGVIREYVVPFAWPKLSPFNLTIATSGTYYDKALDNFKGTVATFQGVSFNAPGWLPGHRTVICNVDGPAPFADLLFDGVTVFMWPPITFSGQDDPYPPYPGNLAVDMPHQLPNLPGGADAGFKGYLTLSHQNRYLVCTRYPRGSTHDASLPGTYPEFGSSAQNPTSDTWFATTPPNDLSGTDKTFQRPYPNVTPPMRFGQAATGYGAAASMNASELLVVREHGGGTAIRGDFDGGTQVSDYPSVPSTHGATNIPAVTPFGMAYGTDNGVYLWAGANETQNLSPYLEGWFWKPEDGSTERLSRGMPHGKFAYNAPFLYAPNNWVCDLRTQGWFRLTEPDRIVYKFYDVSATGQVYATRGKFTQEPPPRSISDNDIVTERYDPTSGTHHYTWTSQPIPITRNRMSQFSEINAVLQGKGTVRMTITGISGATSSVEFDVNSPDTPKAFYGRVNVKCEDAIVKVEAQGTVQPANPSPSIADPTRKALYEQPAPSGDPAPIVHRIALGWQPAESIAKTQ